MDDVSLHFLGSGDAFGGGGRFQACIYVQSPDVRFLIDCGASSLIAMKRAGVDPGSIDAVLVSHLHGDHFGGLPFLILDGQFSRRSRPLVIAGPPGVEARVHQAMDIFFPGSSRTQQRFRLDFVELQDRVATEISSLAVTPYSVVHDSGAPAYALRVMCGGKVIAYSGDTEWTDALVEAAQAASLFICEAYYFDKRVKFHLDYQTLLLHRDRLDCKRIILTHMSADMLAHIDDVKLECAEDGTRLIL